jgi:hypothetical protein
MENEPFIRYAISRDKSVDEPIVRRPAHPRRLVGILVIGRVAAKRQAQLASAPIVQNLAARKAPLGAGLESGTGGLAYLASLSM